MRKENAETSGAENENQVGQEDILDEIKSLLLFKTIFGLGECD